MDVNKWIKTQSFISTAEVKIPEKLADQVIGQDDSVVVIKKAAEQKRHVMLIGEPGTGKSMLA
ncbi:MAG: ATP-binding protein, partial [Thermoplasmata archaeon]|nr:ATP-binding protein [Thermoplasmata archaeon]